MNGSKNYLKLSPNVPFVGTPQFKTPKGPYESKFDPAKQQYLYTLVDQENVEWKFYATEYAHDLIESADYWDEMEGTGKLLCITKVQTAGQEPIQWDVKVAENGQWIPVKIKRQQIADDTRIGGTAQVAPPMQKPPAQVPTPTPTTPQSISAPPSAPPTVAPSSSSHGDALRAMEDLMINCYHMANAVIRNLSATDEGIIQHMDFSALAHCFFIEANRKGLKAVGRTHSGGVEVPPQGEPAVHQTEATAPPQETAATQRRANLDSFIKQAYEAGVEATEIAMTLGSLGIDWPLDTAQLASVPADKWRHMPTTFSRLIISQKNKVVSAVAGALDGEVVQQPQGVPSVNTPNTDDLPF